MDRRIKYDEIPDFTDLVDSNKRLIVSLSPFQTKLFRRLFDWDDAQSKNRLFAYWDAICYRLVIALALVVARNLILLGGFFEPKKDEKIEFAYEPGDGFIDIIINPNAPPNWEEARPV